MPLIFGARFIKHTEWLDRMSHRKWRATKQHPHRATPGHQISCCLVNLHFLCNILSSHSVSYLITVLHCQRDTELRGFIVLICEHFSLMRLQKNSHQWSEGSWGKDWYNLLANFLTILRISLGIPNLWRYRTHDSPSVSNWAWTGILIPIPSRVRQLR